MRLDSYQREIEAIFTASADENDWRDHGREIEAAYRRWLAADAVAASMDSADKWELREFFNVTHAYLRATSQKSRMSELESLFQALEQRGWANERTIKSMHDFYISFRLFDEAEEFRRRYPDSGLVAAPKLLPAEMVGDEGARDVLALSENGSVLERQSLDLGSSKVIVIGHPHCHFSVDAMADIASDPELSKAMNAHAVWLVDPYASMTDGTIANWNKAHPDYAFRYIESQSDWPEINYWGTPSFYFFRDGRLVKKVVGWPRGEAEERKEPLRAGLRAIGAEQ